MISSRKSNCTYTFAFPAAYTDVSNWLLKGGPYDDGERKNQPFLFCFHSWLQKKNMNDPALDENGETFPNVLSGGAVALIRDVPEYVEMQERETQEMKLATPAAPVCWIYSPSIHGSNLLIKIY